MWQANIIEGQPQVAVPAAAGDTRQPGAGTRGDFATLLRQLYSALAAGNRAVLPPAVQIWAVGTEDSGNANGPLAPEVRATPLARGELEDGISALIQGLPSPAQAPPTGVSPGDRGEAGGPQAQPDPQVVRPAAEGPHTLAVNNGSFPVGREQASVPGAAGGQSTPQFQAGGLHEPAHLLAWQPLPGRGEPGGAASPVAGQGPGAREPGTSSSVEPVHAATRVLSSPAILPGQQAGSGETAATAATPAPTSGPEEKNVPARTAGEPRPGNPGPAPGATVLQPAPLPAGSYPEPVAAPERTRRPGINMAAGESSNIWQQPEKVAGPTTSPRLPLARQTGVPGTAGVDSSFPVRTGGPQETVLLATWQPLPGRGEPVRAASPVAGQVQDTSENIAPSPGEGPVRSGPRVQSSPTTLAGAQAESGKVAPAVTSESAFSLKGKELPARPASSAQSGQAVVVGPESALPSDTSGRSPLTIRAPAATGRAQGQDYLPGRGQGAADGSTITDSRPVPSNSLAARPEPGTTTLQPVPLPAGDYPEPMAALERTRRPESNMATGESSIWHQPEKAAVPPTSPGLLVARQITEALVARSHLWQAPGRTKLEIQLEPKSLGRIEVQVTAEAGKLTAHLLVQSHQVKQMVEANLMQLNHNLQPHGLHFDRISVDVDAGQNNFGYWGHQQGGGNHQGGEHRGWYPTTSLGGYFSGAILAEPPVAPLASGAIDYLV
ncbi:MAG: flagellar hook-length control protein FliK [Clostridia bacterium]|nr:MAG: flagellar hook-length control protein FliK [Clostridia bacterium]